MSNDLRGFNLEPLIRNYNQRTEIISKNLTLSHSANTVPQFVVPEHTLFGNQVVVNQQIKTNFKKIGAPNRDDNPLALTLPATQMIESINLDTNKRVLYVNGISGKLVRNQRGNYNISINGDQQFMQGIDLTQQMTEVNEAEPAIIELPTIYDGQASTNIRCGGVLEQPTHPMTGAGETIKLPVFAGSRNNNIRPEDLLIPEDVTQARLVPGSRLKLQNIGQNTSITLEYGGVMRTHKISSSYRVFNAQNSSVPFTIGAGLAEGHSINLQINGQDISTFIFRLRSRAEDNEFSSLDTLYTLLSKINGLSVRMTEGVIYIGAKNPNDSVTFTDSGGTIAAMLGLASNDIPAAGAGIQRFNSLTSLNDAINRLGQQSINSKPGANSVSFAAAAPEEILNVSTDSNNAWFAASQAIIEESSTGMIQIIAPELVRNGIEAGDTLQIDGYHHSVVALDAAGNPITLGGRIKVLKTNTSTGAIFVSTGQRAVGIVGAASAITKPFKLRKVVGGKSIKNLANIPVQIPNPPAGGNLAITFEFAGHGMAVGDKIYISNLRNVIRDNHLSDQAAIAADTLVAVSTIAGDRFTVLVPDPHNELTGLNGLNIDLGNVQIIPTSLAVMTSYSNQNDDKGLIKVYQPRSSQLYTTGDKIAFRNLNAPKIFIGAVNGNYIEKDTNYTVKSVGQDGQGEFFTISAGNDGNVGGLDLVHYNQLGAADTYIEHISDLAAYLGISRSKLGRDGDFGPAYDAAGIIAPNLTQASFSANPALKEQLQKHTTTALGTIIDDRQVEHSYKLSLLPLDDKTVLAEIALLRDALGHYGCAGIGEGSDGIIASGILKRTDGSWESTLPNNITLNWTGPSGEKLGNNTLKFDFQDMKLLHGIATTVAQNIHDETGRKPIQIEDVNNILINGDGTVQVKDRDGNVTAPIYQLVLYQVDNPEDLKAVSGTSGYSTSHDSGHLHRVDQNNIKVQAHSSYSSGIDITEQQIGSMDYMRYVQSCFIQHASTAKFQEKIDSIIHNMVL